MTNLVKRLNRKTESGAEYRVNIPILHLTYELYRSSISNAIALIKLNIGTMAPKVSAQVESGAVSIFSRLQR